MDHRDLAYADRSPRNVLDYYAPDGGATLPPLVVYIHGGAFMMGDKANTEWNDTRTIAALVEAGFAVASMNYRLTPQAIWPAQLEDLRSALAWLRARAGDLGFDANRIASFGPSAGGHLSACAAVDLARDKATALQACVAWFPPVDFAQMDADMIASGVERLSGRNDAPDSPESRLIGAPVAQNPALARAASPLGLLDRLAPGTPLPPVFIQHGAQDGLIAARQSERLQAALAARGAQVTLEILPDGTHGGGAFDDPATLARAVAFLKSAFGG